MEPTTPSSDGGDAPASVPQENTEAVSLGEAGAPTLRPRVAPTSTPQSQIADEPEAPAAPNPGENQPEPAANEPTAPVEDDLADWAGKQGIDFDNPTPDQARQLAKRLRDTQQKMHEATEQAKVLQSSMTENANLPYTGNQEYDSLAAEVNQIKIQNRVENYFRANPEARNYEEKMAEIVVDRPWLQNDLEALHALAVNSPSRAAELKKEGGREALTNLAQKQSAVPPQSNASTGVSTANNRITSANVDEIVAAHMGDTKWYSANKAAIDSAMAGTR